MKKLIPIAFAALVLLCLPAAASATGPGRIEGTVTPTSVAPEVEICLVETPPSEICTSPGPSGTYQLTEVPIGSSRVEFVPSRRSAYLLQYYQHAARLSEARQIFISPMSLVATGVDANLVLGAVIEGTATRSGGIGVPEVEVCALAVGTRAAAACDETDAAGEYSLPGIAGGSYKIGFWGRGASAVYGTRFYTAASSFATATPITVVPESVKAAVDVELERGAAIEGSVSEAAGGARLGDVPVCLFAGAAGRPERCAFTDDGGGYSFLGLPAGDYQVGFSLSAAEAGEAAAEGTTEDGFLSQYWNGVATRAEATTISLVSAQTATGIDARLQTPPAPVSAPPVAPVASPAVPAPPVISEPKQKRQKKKLNPCKRGYKKQKVKGKQRCVKVHEKKHPKHAKHKHGNKK